MFLLRDICTAWDIIVHIVVLLEVLIWLTKSVGINNKDSTTLENEQSFNACCLFVYIILLPLTQHIRNYSHLNNCDFRDLKKPHLFNLWEQKSTKSSLNESSNPEWIATKAADNYNTTAVMTNCTQLEVWWTRGSEDGVTCYFAASCSCLLTLCWLK